MKALEKLIEQILWSSRLVVVIPVLFSLALSVGAFLTTSVDAIGVLGNVVNYISPSLTESTRNSLRLETISLIVQVVDGYLLAAILLIFALGLYELFVNKIDLAEGSEFAKRLLLIRSLDDLKDRLAKVILLVLVVKFFQQALALKYTSVNDLLLLAVSIALVGVTIYLTAKKDDKEGYGEDDATTIKTVHSDK